MKTILITRTAHQAQDFIEALMLHGYQAINLPSLIIEAHTDHEDFHFALQRWQDADILIFVSANAVRYSQAFWPAGQPKAKIFAIGPATQSALSTANLASEPLPLHYSSNGLLDLPELQKEEVSRKKVLILSGEESKPLLPQTLASRGAEVFMAACYRRSPAQLKTSDWEKLKSHSIDSIVSCSLQSFLFLMNMFQDPVKQAWLISKSLVVISPLMKSAAIHSGFPAHRIFVASQASSSAIVKCLHDKVK